MQSHRMLPELPAAVQVTPEAAMLICLGFARIGAILSAIVDRMDDKDAEDLERAVEAMSAGNDRLLDLLVPGHAALK